MGAKQRSKYFPAKLIAFTLVFFLLNSTVHKQTIAQTTLTPEQMLEELEHVADLIRRVHPDPFHAGSEEDFNSLVAELSQRIISNMPKDEFFFLLNQLTHYVKDAHTTIYNPDEQLYLPAHFYWAMDGLVVAYYRDGCGLEFGDKILSIGGKDPWDLLEELSKIISAENLFWIKSYGVRRLSRGSFLKYLGRVVNNKVKLVVEDKQGNVQEVEVKLSPDPLPSDPSLDRGLCGWQINQAHSLGYFYLDRCINSGEYLSALNSFFREVKEQGIERIAVDLRRNPGGTSRVVNEFLKFLPVKAGGWLFPLMPSNVRTYAGEVRYSPEAAAQRGYSITSGYYKLDPVLRRLGIYMEIPRLAYPDLIFQGDIYILISNSTFSSGNWFGVIFKDNNMGMLVGEPTGNAPTHFGDILHFTTPYSNFQMIISHKKFYRPDYTQDSADALYPDFYIPTTVQDIREGRDPQLDNLLSIFSAKKLRNTCPIRESSQK